MPINHVHMPASLRRHNLARLREELGISQTDLAQWVGRSWSAIKAIETGKLALSPELAALIASTTGTDKNWLLANDLSAPMPPLERVSARLAPQNQAYGYTLALLHHLIDRIFASIRRLRPTPSRDRLQIYIAKQFEILFKTEQEPDAAPFHLPRISMLEFFKAHPEFMDPDLSGAINIEYILREAYRREKMIDAYGRKLQRENPESREFSEYPFDVTALSSPAAFVSPDPQGKKTAPRLPPKARSRARKSPRRRDRDNAP
jgi:DNA-binding XRE family transcriptional regulator